MEEGAEVVEAVVVEEEVDSPLIVVAIVVVEWEDEVMVDTGPRPLPGPRKLANIPTKNRTIYLTGNSNVLGIYTGC